MVTKTMRRTQPPEASLRKSSQRRRRLLLRRRPVPQPVRSRRLLVLLLASLRLRRRAQTPERNLPVTYYSTGLGACGVTSSDTDRIVALSQELYDLYTTNGNSNDNSLCGKTIHIEYGSSSTDVTVVDRCTGCSSTDLDLSPTAFTDLASEDDGRLYGASWYFTS
ncbi:hypothetical protein ARMSODRAFT_641635 [Armillaria solidipes]|uniref:RlpA-like protein double-psi beta-barrel domain-containing protein n=1 Tax=Armillaria solidipes TaxID=1076256 RepID=A0A2H3CE82_9AGAR|nr:hypothetical protein ARMSODRAFT_641635 [Armillaria solidipes]